MALAPEEGDATPDVGPDTSGEAGVGGPPVEASVGIESDGAGAVVEVAEVPGSRIVEDVGDRAVESEAMLVLDTGKV